MLVVVTELYTDFIHSVSSSNTGAIVGGTVGGLATVAIVAAVAIGGVVVLKKSRMKSKSNHKCAHVYVILSGFIFGT